MHVYYFYLPVMNLGAYVMIASVSVMVSEVAIHHTKIAAQGSVLIDPCHCLASYLINTAL